MHAADLHLDTPFVGIGRVAPEVRARLRDASLEAFDNLVQAALDRNAAFVLLAGDLYDGAERGVRAQLRFLRGVERLGQGGIPVFAVHGNHDPLDGWSAIRQPPENLILFGSERVEARVVGSLATLYGISYPRREVEENLARRFRRGDGPGLHIALLHASVNSQPEHAPYSPCTLDDLCAAGMDYWALGHIHQRQVLRDGNPWVVYPGNLQGRGVKSSELGAKGAMLVHASDDRIERVRFLPLDCVRFQEAPVDIGGLADLDALRKAVRAEIARLRESERGRDLVVRVVLSGRGPLREDLRREGALDGLLEELRQELAEPGPILWLDRITDRSGSALDRAALAQRGDFPAEILRCGGGLRDEPLRQFVEERLAPLRKPRIAWLPEMDSWDWSALLREAEDRAVDLLESEQER